MRKALWSAAALLALLSGSGVILGETVNAADGPVGVNMVEGSQSNPSTWKFEPENIKVPVGTKVVWTNKGKIEHTATAQGLFDSKTMPAGATFEFTFTTPGVINYVCEPHESLGMTGVIEVVGGSTQSTAATTATTAGGTTATTAAGAGSTTTTTAKAAAGGSTTTTTAGGGVTSTTQAPSVTPTSAPETGGVTTTTTGAATGGGEEAAADGAPKSGGDDKSSPIGIAFVSASTLMLLGISGKLLASKS